MKRIFLALIAAVLPVSASAAPTTLRVAILDNLKIEKLSTDKYANDYMDGIAVARHAAAKNGYEVEIKEFFYGKEPLAVLKMVPEVIAWQPDLVIGPRASSLFLLLNDHFKDVLVLSPFATASAVADMPKNFRSMTLPNRYFTQAAVNLVRDRFPGRAIAPIVEVDCKNCMDFADEFAKLAPTAKVIVRDRATYLNKNVETVDLKQLLSRVQGDDLLLVPNTSYTSGAIIPRIANHLQRGELIVVGGDGWGDWTSSYVGKVKSEFPYTGYRVTPWSFDARNDWTRLFVEDYKAIKGTPPSGPDALISYATLSAAVGALPRGGLGKGEVSARAVLLASFQAKVAVDPNYGRPTSYAIYKVTQGGESIVGEVSALETGKK